MGRSTVRALSRTCCEGSTLWLWPGQALYTGPSLDLGMHKGSVACLAVGLDAPFLVHVPGRAPLTARSVLMPPRLLHRVDAQDSRMTFCYLDPGSSYASACRTRMTMTNGLLRHTHRAESDLTRVAAEAGFSSPSHLSSSFHGMFGLAPSRLLAVPLTIHRSERSP